MSSRDENYPLDQFDFDWEALNDYDHTLALFPHAPGAPDFDFFDDRVDSATATNAELTNRKHKRDQASNETDHEVVGDCDDTSEVAKAMRHGGFGRIIAESVVASGSNQRAAVPHPPDASMEERWARRKEVVVKFMRCLNFSDMGTLAKVIRENCHECVMFMSPEVRDPIYGKADMMILFSLMMEAYPDGVWKIVSTDNEEDKVACRFSFRGTKVFPYPLETVLKQIKAHMNKEVYMTNSPAMASIQLVQDIAERVHPTVADRFREEPVAACGSEQGSVARSVSSDSHSLKGVTLNEEVNGDSQVMMPRVNQLIRPTKMLETAVLREGLVTYRRQTDFIFNEYDQIVRVIAEDLS